ncbi:MAG: hypothetical protein QOG15_28 [Solirubrobacteraceae bacterium]|jgi:signal transduction histidine kinase|nr:hypothetical protein [Solirubrobacteraceae bacterium]
MQHATTKGRSLDGVFESLYRRIGARYMDGVLATVLAGVLLFVVPVWVFVLLSFWGPSGAEYLRAVAAYELVLGLVAGPGSFLIARRLAPHTYRWAAGEKREDLAVAAWAEIVTRLPRWILLTGLWYTAWCVPPALYIGARLDFGWDGVAIFMASVGGLNLVALVVVYLFSEQALRPLVREMASLLPPGADPPHGGMTLSAKALIVLPAANFLSAVFVAALVSEDRAPEAHLGHVVLLALAISASLSLVLTLLFRQSVLRRVEDLSDAMRRVDEGDLRTRVTPLAGDELDDMGATFNDMVAGLRERESLRSHNAELVGDLRRQADQLRDSRKRIVAASHAARRRVERDLHDGAQQRLVLLRLKLGLARAGIDGDAATAAALDDLRDELDRALLELRELARGIYPTILENDGLPAALRDAVLTTAVPTEIACEATGRYSPELEAAVYFCCVEALQNAAKHAGAAARARVTLAQGDDTLIFEVADDGAGFDPSTAAESAGLQNMADRIGALGGSLEIDSAQGGGTRISGTVPATLAD